MEFEYCSGNIFEKGILLPSYMFPGEIGDIAREKVVP